ncbi:sulfotransferase [Palleronia caenipelagi]|nr:sulfotransferase [Palleronia caenipelagi]
MDIVERIKAEFPQIAEVMSKVPETFAPDWLMASAVQETGLDDFGPDTFREPLERLCASINEDADLNPYGRLLFASVIRNQLGNRLLLQDTRKNTPERLSEPLVPPIIVTGLPRTGTTFLHRLLAADPAHASLPFWQLNRPIPRNAEDTKEKRIADVEALLDVRRKVTPELDGTHLIRAEAPEECLHMTGVSGFTRLYWNLGPVYSFQRWLSRVDKADKYRDYVDLLHYLQGEYPGKRLVLKAPDHNDGVAELLDALPEARVILTHRDIVEQIGSFLSLGRTTRKLAVNALDTAKEAEGVIDMTDVSLQKMAEARIRHPDRILDVRYTDMMADPLASVERIYEFCGLTLAKSRRDAIAEHHARNPKGKHGKHEYSLAEFGLENDWVRDRYKDYVAEFVD